MPGSELVKEQASPPHRRGSLHLVCNTVLLGFLLGAAGCEVGPNYKKPAMNVPPALPTTPTVNLARWWETFGDPELNSLMARSVRTNLDVRLAEARVRQARALLDEQTAGLFPTVNTDANYTRSRGSQFNGAVGTTTTTDANGNIITTVRHSEGDLFQAGFDAAWEIDVFGGTRRAIDAAAASYESLIEARRNTLVTLMSEVAQNYIILRASQSELNIAIENARSQSQTLELTRSKFRAGLTSDLDVAQSEAQVASTESQIPTFQTSTRQAIFRIAVLMGEQPAALEGELLSPGPIPPPPLEVPAGLTTDLLRRRADVRQAERNLAAATADIGVAVSELFPRFSLTGSVGTEGNRVKQIGNSRSIFFSWGPSVTWPIFDAGKLWANVHVQDALQQQAMIEYQQAVLVALEDVEDSLVAYSQQVARRQTLAQSVSANKRAVALAEQLYSKGLVDFLNVLTAQASLYAAEDSLAQSDRLVSTNLVALYKSLGGGWESVEQKLPPLTPPALPATQPSIGGQPWYAPEAGGISNGANGAAPATAPASVPAAPEPGAPASQPAGAPPLPPTDTAPAPQTQPSRADTATSPAQP